MNIYILIAAILPVLVLLFYIYRKDAAQPEPKKEMVKAFSLGLVSVAISFMFSIPFQEMGLFSVVNTTLSEVFRMAFFAAAIPEELAKYIMLWYFMRKTKHFDQRIDGIVYAVCISLGFAAFENVMYLFTNQDNWIYVGASRALTSVPGHFGFGVLMGYYYSLSKFDSHLYATAKYKAILVPILVHGIFDVICFVSDIAPYLALFMTVVLFVFCHKLWKYGSMRIKEHVERDSNRGNFSK